jgi:two-component system, sensor histidine kinase and response regulator
MPSNMGLSSKVKPALLLGLLSCLLPGLLPAQFPQPQSTIRNWMDQGKLKQITGRNDEALTLFTKAQCLALQHSLFPELCEAKIKIGEIIYDHGHYDSALTWFHQADSIAETHTLPSAHAYSLYYMGKYNETKGNFQQAKIYYDSALIICRQNKDLRQLALILPSRGKNYLSEGKLNLALQCYLEAFQLSEQLDDQLLYAETSSHLGSLYLQIGQYDKALEYDKRALTCRGILENPEGLAKSYNNIGNVFSALKQPDSALFYYFHSLELCRNTNYQKGMVKALNNIGNLYIGEQQKEKALKFLDTAFRISNQAGYGFGIAASSVSLADIYAGSRQIAKAIHLYRLSLARLDQTDYDEMLGRIYKGLFECYNARGEYQSALQYHIRLLDTEKKLLNVENARQLAILNISFDLERKEKDNQVLRTDNELKESLIKRKTIFIWLIVIALGFTIALCVNIYYRRRIVTDQNTALAVLNQELEKANQEKDKLFSIISHELRNPLYWFQNLSEVLSKKFKEMPADKVQKSLSALDESAKNAFHLMDNLLQWSRSKLNRIHPKKGEHLLRRLVSDTADMYLTILRYKEIEFRNTIPANIKIYADADLFCCVIRNLISNAIKYTPSSGTISIEYGLTPDQVTVIVKDSGIGIPRSDINSVFSDHVVSIAGLMQEKGSGIGLRLCKDFVELNGGTIWAESVPGSTQFYFTIPVAHSLAPHEQSFPHALPCHAG